MVAEANAVVGPLERMLNWARSGSLWPLTVGLACCGTELLAAENLSPEWEQLGIRFQETPSQADCLVVAGSVSKKMVPLLQALYAQMPWPRYVVALGSCAGSGGLFPTYAVVQGVARIIPVDVYVPGCPPRPEALLAGFCQLQEKIRRESA